MRLGLGAILSSVKFFLSNQTMNSSLISSAVMAGFGVLDLFYPGAGNPAIDFGFAMVFLGFGLLKDYDPEA